MGRGLYNQDEGNEFRQASAAFQERLDDNRIVEGLEEKALKSYAKGRLWTEFQVYIQKLREKGWSETRIQSLVSRATAGIKF